MSRGALFWMLLCLALAAGAAEARQGQEQEEKEKPAERTEQARETDASSSEAKGAPEPKAKPRVYTNEDLKTAGEGGGIVTSPVIEGLPRPAPRRSGAAGGDEPSEAEWRSRANAARDRIGKAEARVEALEQRIAEVRQDRDPQAGVLSPYREQERQARLTEAREDLEEAEAELDAARKALEDLRREARRAGVPPGWLR